MYSIVTSRFSNETRDDNYKYRKKHNFACLYCCPRELSPKIMYNTPVFVIEMNNSTNKIEGIGLIKNSPQTKKYYKVHVDGNFNRYIYVGNHFIEREMIDNELIIVLEKVLFKGKTHSKRGIGLTIFPKKLEIYENINIKKEIKKIFPELIKDTTTITKDFLN